MTDGPAAPRTRRADYAEQTRQAIVDAGRALFAERGYFATRVDDVAAAARVAPKTVYAVVGGKAGLLQLLVEAWVDAPVMAASLARIREVTTAREVLEVTAAGVRQIVTEHGDVIATTLAAAPHDAAAAEGLARGRANIRRGLDQVARELDRRGALADGVTVERAGAVLAFYFGTSGYATLTGELGWEPGEAETWLAAASVTALLRERPPAPSSAS